MKASKSTFIAKKELGQNFLVDVFFATKMVDSLEIKPANQVIEIGPGLGALTNKILNKLPQGKLRAIEFDPRFADKLKNEFAYMQNFEIIYANALDWLPNFSLRESFKIIGSLPYYITSPILHAVVYMQKPPEMCVFLIQKEVAEKITQKAPNGSYLSNFLQTFFDIELVCVVPNTAFDPVPQVDGAIIKMKLRASPPIAKNEIKKYEGFLHKGFANPRKMLNKVFTQRELEKVGITTTLRPQNLILDEWLRLFATT